MGVGFRCPLCAVQIHRDRGRVARAAGHRGPGPARQPACWTAAPMSPTWCQRCWISPELDPVAPDIRGRSLLPMLSGARTAVYGDDEAVGFEVSGNSALYRGNWKISRIPDTAGRRRMAHVRPRRPIRARPRTLQAPRSRAVSGHAERIPQLCRRGWRGDRVPADYNPFEQIRKKRGPEKGARTLA